MISHSFFSVLFYGLIPFTTQVEEEIPTALYLLRMIPKSSLEGQLGLSYAMFLISAMCRLAIGYMFLFNVLLVVVQSNRVLGKFMCKLRVFHASKVCIRVSHKY